MLCFMVWAMLYGLSYSLPKLLFPAVLPYAVLVYAVLFLVWLEHRRCLRAFRICRPALNGWTGLLVMSLFLLLPAANLLSGGSFADRNTVVLMLGTVIVEEVFFRGVLLAEPGTFGVPLFAWISEQPDFAKAVFSSGLFAVLHAVNAISGEEWVQTVPQILCAFCAGMLFAAVTLRTDSLIPAAAGHFLVNITATEEKVFSFPVMAGSILCLAAGILLLLHACSVRKGTVDEIIH